MITKRKPWIIRKLAMPLVIISQQLPDSDFSYKLYKFAISLV